MNTETPAPGIAPASLYNGERKDANIPDAHAGSDRPPRATRREMAVRKGQILTEPGDRHRKLFVVLSGSLEVVRPTMAGEKLVIVVEPGSFTGEMSNLRGVGGLTRTRVREDGEVLAITDDQLRISGANRRATERADHARVHPASCAAGLRPTR